MPPTPVRFHPAAAQEADSAFDWYADRDLSAAHAFREYLRHAVDAIADNPLTGRVMDAMPDGTSSHAFRSAWCTDCAAMKSRSLPLLTAGDGRVTGSLGCERPSNFRIQRPVLRAAADPARSAHRGASGW